MFIGHQTLMFDGIDNYVEVGRGPILFPIPLERIR
jgi:hypothetical protein